MRKRMIGTVMCILGVILGLALIAGDTVAAAPFFEGKVIRVVVGVSAGGGYDTYARLIARHIGRHIPGNPTVIVENMPGAGSLIAANYLYKAAKPDGLTIGHFMGGLLLGQILGQEGILFDAPKFEYIGVPAQDSGVLIFSRQSGIVSIEKWMASKTPVKIGGVAPGTIGTDNTPRILKAALGLPVQMVSGYKGTTEIRLAVESGEIAGCCPGWESARTTWRKGLETEQMGIVLQAVPKPMADLPQVPLAISLAKSEEARQLIDKGIHSANLYARPFTMPPGTPKDRVQIIRTAFQETLKDEKFLAEAEKSRLAIAPITGEELEKTIRGLFGMDQAFRVKLKHILLE